MANPGQLALIHAEIDGELDPAQRAELARAVLADPEVRELRDGLRRVCQALDSVPQVEPPPGLRASILAAMPQKLRPSPGLKTRLGSRPVSRPTIAAWRYAAMFAGVLAAGGVIFELVRNPAPELRELAGTIAAAPAATLVETAAVANGADGLVSGQVSLYRDRATLTLRFEVTASIPVDARVTSEGHVIEIVGVNRAAAPATATPGAGTPATGAPGTPIAAALPGVAMHGQAIDVTLISGGHPVGAVVLRAPGGP
jgi:hypothetical protein